MPEFEFEKSLKRWWKAIKNDPRLFELPTAPTFDLIDDASFEIAQVVPYSTPAIEVASSFSQDIKNELNRNLHEASQAILCGLEFGDANEQAEEFVRSALKENVVSFVVLHELFHILAGHLREQAKFSDSELPLSEMSLGMASSQDSKDVDESELLKAYYREFEVDDCALQALVQLSLHEETLSFLSSIETDEQEGMLAYELINSTGLPKVFGYRLMAVSAWLVVRLIESKRSPQIRQQFDTHPLPSARLLSCFTTLLEEYARLSGEALDSDGRRSRKPSHEQADAIVEFFDLVFKPMSMFLHPIETHPSRSATPIANLAEEMGTLMFDGKMQTDAGRLVLRLQSLRPEMEDRLSNCRYYTSF
jgi:hypothetical protein